MKKTTIQISTYEYSVGEEIIYEAEVDSLAGFLALTYYFNKRARYKKSTDKNWYYGKTLLKRLFKKELAENHPTIKFFTTNDLDKIFEEKRIKKEEQKRKEEERERQEYELLKKEEMAFQAWRRENPVFTIEQLDSMTPEMLELRLFDLYDIVRVSRKSDYNYYDGAFEDGYDEIDYIRQLIEKAS